MATPARILNDLVVELCDLDRVRISTASEIKGMPESVIRFDRVLADDVVRSVAVVAGGHRVMAGFHPGVVLRLHYVAVGAGSGVVRKVGDPLA